jgi:hypothetical protein
MDDTKRLTALKELAEHILDETADCPDVWGGALNFINYSTVAKSYHGSLNHALILHEFVLGNMSQYSIVTDPTCGKVTVCFWPEGLSIGPEYSAYSWFQDNPARAWLLAIIRVLIKELENK